MCTRRFEESRKKMRFKFVFEIVHVIDSADSARQPIPNFMGPATEKARSPASGVKISNNCQGSFGPSMSYF